MSQLKSRIEKILHVLEKKNPDAHCELVYKTPFQLLVSVVLSAQTTDKSVNKCMEPLYKEGFTPETVLKLGADGLLAKIRTIGLAPTKSKNVFKLSQIVHEKFNNQIPRTREDLEDLPGVGRKTASVILGEIYGEPTLAVDTHVYRVTKRLGFHKAKDPQECEQKLLKLIDPKFLPKAHHLFILHGRYTCLARGPKCEECVIGKKLCPSFGKE